MKKRINIWAFIFSIICVLLFCIVSFSGFIDFFILGAHPLTLVLSITLITFFLGLVGFSGIEDWKGAARSVTTVILTLGLSVFLTYVIFIGKLMG